MPIIRYPAQTYSPTAAADTPWHDALSIAAKRVVHSSCQNPLPYLTRVSTPAPSLVSNGLLKTLNCSSSLACSVFLNLTPNDPSPSFFLSTLRRNSVCNPDFPHGPVTVKRCSHCTAAKHIPVPVNGHIRATASLQTPHEKTPGHRVSLQQKPMPGNTWLVRGRTAKSNWP